MKKWLKRPRGAVGMALTWAAGWTPVGAVIGLVAGVFLWSVPLGAVAAIYARTFAVLGFVGGAIFSNVLRITEGRRRFDELSLPRFAAWGALGGLLLGVLAVISRAVFVPLDIWFMDAVVAVVAITLMGAGSAAGSLALARRAEDRELLEDGADVADIGLTKEETRELLGT